MFSEGSDEEVLVGDIWSDVFLGTEFSCLVDGDEPFFKFSPEDALQ